MENEQNKNELILNTESKMYLEETRKWTLFISIVGMVFMALIVVLGFSMGAIFSQMSEFQSVPNFPSAGIGFIYLFIAAIYFFPLLYLLRFSTYTKKGIRNSDTELITLAFKNLKLHYSFLGIVTAIIVGLYVLIAIIGGAVTALF